MTSCAEGHHTAFVIMPFGVEFDEIYEDSFKPVLTSAGFEVNRSDELTNSAESIMRTIIRQIEDSCLIVADLTDSNPNVYYELGIAHAMHKPVINLTQAVDELPFDIRGHRVISYSTYFRTMNKAKEELARVAEGVFDGSTTFGNPFSDHASHRVTPTCSNNSASSPPQGGDEQSGDSDDPPGFLDHQVAMQEGFEDISRSIEDIANRTNRFNDSMQATTTKLDSTRGRGVQSQARDRQTLVRMLAQEMNGYALFLSDENDKYGAAIERTRPALEGTLNAIEPSNEEDATSLNELLSSLDEVEQVVLTFRDNTEAAAAIIGGLPDVERSFMRARDQVANQLRRLAGNIDQLISMITRTREMALAKLDQQSDQSSPTA